MWTPLSRQLRAKVKVVFDVKVLILEEEVVVV